MINYQNGNAHITLYEDGTRVIEYEGELKLDACLNIDIRVSNKCAFGLNPKTGKAFCTFCHESQRTDGEECDYERLKEVLSPLPIGVEFAIGANNITDGLVDFIEWSTERGNIVNITINQGHVNRDLNRLRYLITNDLIKGLGISYRSSLPFNVPKEILEYEHTVIHLIVGIDKFEDVKRLSESGVRKILLLGEKNFGFNLGKVDLTTKVHKEWVWWVHKLFSVFDVVSFDNLALQQLNIKRFFTEDNWNTFNQGEHSLYVEAVSQMFAPSSRSDAKVSFNDIGIKEYFLRLEESGK
jgi:hypothetical protein